MYRKLQLFMNLFELSACAIRIQRCPSCGLSLMVRFAKNPIAVRCLRCHSSSITMALIAVMDAEIKQMSGGKFYELSSRGAVVEHLRRKQKDLTVSEYYDDVPPGEWRDQVQCQDVQHLSYPTATFDVCTSTEVFEHVPDDMAGFREIRRVLKPGGVFIFTVPFVAGAVTVERVKLVQGAIQHLLPAMYHGDAIRGANHVLVYRDFGYDILERLSAAGFSESKIVTSKTHKYLGYGSYVFVARA